MDQYSFYNLVSTVGPEFLSYILNYQKDITYNSELDSLELSPVQMEVLLLLAEQLRKCHTQRASNPNYSIAHFLFDLRDINGECLFNSYRKKCSGGIINIKEKDLLLEYILTRSIHYYPSLLLKDDLFATMVLGDKSSLFGWNEDEAAQLIDLLKKDDHLGRFVTLEQDGSWWYGYVLDNNLPVHVQGSRFFANLLTRAFYNCCYKNAYSLEDFLQEVRKNMKQLKAIAKGQEITWSVYCGLYGLNIQQDEVVLSDEFQIRGIGKSHTIIKSLNDTIAIGHIGDYPESIPIGAILQINLTGKAGPLSLDNQLTATLEFIPRIVNNLNLAIAFSTKQNYKPVVQTFTDIDVPMMGIWPYWDESKTSNTTILEDTDIPSLKEWFFILENSNQRFVSIPLRRLKNAIFERDNPEDGILDAFIAWEGMFSKKYTPNVVSQSIDKYYFIATGIRLPEGRTKKLFELRNTLFHGKPEEDDILKDSSLTELRDEIVDITLECIKALLKDKKLLELRPEERVKEILG